MPIIATQKTNYRKPPRLPQPPLPSPPTIIHSGLSEGQLAQCIERPVPAPLSSMPPASQPGLGTIEKSYLEPFCHGVPLQKGYMGSFIEAIPEAYNDKTETTKQK
jgi:hypothetical protein